tara:strand:- start:170 stop:736 length:567 start_codon:yes stop_codon:yes gene_type:complete
MIYIIDDFLDKKLFNVINNNLGNFKKISTKDKDFWTIEPSNEFIDYMVKRLSYEENADIENILSFFRESKQDQDNKWRIHNDSIIYNKQPNRALVFYLSDNNYKELNGTAFWKHKFYGDKFDESQSTEEFNRMLVEDANDLSKWELKSVIGHKKNRLLSYPCEYFHSKYPNEFIESRKVFVMFYKSTK